jgi:glycosyltransferase involved in cell wall biosynthesis
LLRAGLLARYLAAIGHEVVWWTSTFDHTQKVHLFESDTVLQLPDGVTLRALRGRGYRRNVSLQRILDHRQVASAFEAQAASAPRPDVILASYPTIELAGAAARFGARHGIPCVIDIRDLWPDLFIELLPRWMRGLAAPALAVLRRKARRVCREAYAIIGNAPHFVEWGLRLAGRPARSADRYFPFAYAPPQLQPERRAEAQRFWEQHGIRRDGDAVIGCFFGAFSQQFDFDTVIAAAAELTRRGTNYRFVLCGTGERLARLQEAARTNPRLLLPGWIGQPEIFALMEAAHFGLAPYWNNVGFVDNLPNKPIEYMAGGLAVVSSLSGYLREFIARAECGFHYPEGDAGALADLVEGFARDRGPLERARSNARRAFEQQFDATLVHKSLADYLEAVSVEARERLTV